MSRCYKTTITDLQGLQAVTDDKRVLKQILIDVLNLRTGMEDNLLLIQNVYHTVKNIKSVSTDLMNAISVVQQHIDSMNRVCTLGVSWLKYDVDFSLNYITDAQNERDDPKPKENPECEIKIEIPDWKNAVIIDHKNDMNITGCVENSETEHVDSLVVNIMETQVYPATDDVKRVDVKEAVCVEPGVKNCVKSIDKLIPKMKTSKRVKKEMVLKQETQSSESNEGSDKNDVFRFPCNLCDYRTNRKNTLKRHTSSVHLKIRYNCDECNKTFSQPKSLERHKLNIHQGERVYCEECSFSTPRVELLKLHQNSVHKDIKFVCTSCDFIGLTERQFIIHKVLRHNETDIAENQTSFPCDKCDYVAGSISYLKIHVRKHNNGDDESLICDQCEYVAPRKLNLKLHMENKHSSVLYTCDQCEYKCYSKVTFKLHKKKHEGRFLCDQCPFIGTLKSHLKNHMKIKHDGFRVPCDSCKFMAQTQQHLKRHKEAVHIGVKYPCDLCSFSFSNKSNLKEHKACKHDDTKHPCEECDYLASSQIALRKHMKTKHPCATQLQ
ncbi:zinc finger protein 142-like isoform X3 [Eurytemora carolleeae]|uniref:zinc finger protein 142-like isoform X3 n=1 Tax=Eurytemora carolleeae TaxID=1294199 RepID=UPI000C7866C4|nr:zinc finger protein 142-like isoform X3 [Eurytemora carolleeae]XP_023321201.1 zinc finger protein 142-like isoform X3 [Eurytemora carolleeae]XP_023321202.1 zinc finger protein 142-like isoform X3 [Eurytemora carolleeae]XP_023321203.1 zinc finger protein 142-like isoform X3 [Eurytemora carolleeae]XP_023321204.1 zinc finger protein 142-like isoform X3 [Eurytemora carolleeae]|eukprot:XP_023321199.1 zinc finger protein 142-like isoform X3 [Eurytemora affinis]